MTKPTIQQRLVAELTRLGETVVPDAKTKKYIVMTRGNAGRDGYFWYVGKSGALRTGKTVTTSVPRDDYKRFLLTPPLNEKP